MHDDAEGMTQCHVLSCCFAMRNNTSQFPLKFLNGVWWPLSIEYMVHLVDGICLLCSRLYKRNAASLHRHGMLVFRLLVSVC